MQIQNTVVLVTGANRGIGAALVRAVLEEGASKVYAAARHETVSRGRLHDTVVGDRSGQPDLVAVMRLPDAETIRGFLESHTYQVHVRFRNEAFEDVRSYIADDLMAPS